MAKVVVFTDCLTIGWGRCAGPYRLATELRDAGYSTQVVDFYGFYDRKEICRILDKLVTEETLLVGVSSVFLTDQNKDVNREGFVRRQFPLRWQNGDPHLKAEVDFMNFVFAEAKKRSSRCKTAIGGGLSNELCKVGAQADYFVQGSADYAILEMVRHIENPEHALITSEESSRIILSDRHYPFTGFDESRIDYQKSDGIFPGEALPMDFSRGCIFKCGFCDFPGVGKRKGSFQKTPAILKRELIDNYEAHGVTDYMFMDNLVNDSVEKMKVLHGVITNLPFKIRWHSFSRIDMYTHHPEMITLAKEMGCISQYFGVESFSKLARKMIGKGSSAEKDIETMFKLKEAIGPELSISIGLIIGLPGETYEEMEKTIEWLLSGKSPIDAWGLSPLYLDRNGPTPFATNPQIYGFRFPDPKDPSYWEHDITNAHEAKIRASEFQHQSAEKNRVGAYMLFRLMNLGYKFEEVQSMSMAQMSARKHQILKRSVKLKNRYLSNLFETQGTLETAQISLPHGEKPVTALFTEQ